MRSVLLKGIIFIVLAFASLKRGNGHFVAFAEDIKPTKSSESKVDRTPAEQEIEKIKRLKVKNLSDLDRLTPYETVSVIQKRYLRKTSRGELGLSLFPIINHNFFYIGGLSTRLGFFLRENHSFGLEGFALLKPFFKSVAVDIIEAGAVPGTPVFPSLYGGAYYKWSPIFGKFSVLNGKIIYFDMYVSLSAGVTRLFNGGEFIADKVESLIEGQMTPEKKQELTQHKLSRNLNFAGGLSLGQVFALNQNWAFNWELKCLWSMYKLNTQQKISFPNPDIGLSLGINWYFPSANER